MSHLIKYDIKFFLLNLMLQQKHLVISKGCSAFNLIAQ